MPLSVARDIVQASVTAESDVHLQWAQRLVGEAPCKENGGRWQSVAPMMLPDTWAIVGMWLADHSVLDAGARGAKRKRADRFYRQSERIRAELVKLVKHPGYHGVAMLGQVQRCNALHSAIELAQLCSHVGGVLAARCVVVWP